MIEVEPLLPPPVIAVVRRYTMSLAIDAFVDNVRRYCDWFAGSNHDLLEARQSLLALMQGIPHLLLDRTSTGCRDAEYPRFDYDDWKRNYRSLGDFSIQYYQQFFDPLCLENADAVVGDAHDDLADIFGELWHGLHAFDGDDTIYAINYWRDSYFGHWGHHAAAVIYAIDEYYRRHCEIDEQSD